MAENATQSLIINEKVKKIDKKHVNNDEIIY